jgi:hypothetical protein
MWWIDRRWRWRSGVGLLALGAAALAWACGAEFPWLLGQRKETLLASVELGFDDQAPRLVAAPAQPLKAGADRIRHDVPLHEALAKAREAAELADLAPAQRPVLLKLRQLRDGEAVLAEGSALPAAITRYVAGAVHFNKSQELHAENPAEDLAKAARHFEAVLALGEAPARPRAVWAAYMLGRTRAAQRDVPAAVAAFERTRDLARRGWPDPLFLGLASLGEEARLRWHASAGDSSAAVGLYALQAAQGSENAIDSLNTVAGLLLLDAERLDASLHDRTVQRLLLTYVLSFGEGDPEPWHPDPGSLKRAVAPTRAESAAAAASAASASSSATQGAAAPASAAGGAASAPVAAPSTTTTTPVAASASTPATVSAPTPAESSAAAPTSAERGKRVRGPNRLQRLADAFERLGVDKVEDADRLAALAYTVGRYDLASRLLQRPDTPLAHWTAAKLALRRGQPDVAARHYADALKPLAAAPAAAVASGPAGLAAITTAQTRLRAEQGVLSLARGEFIQALQQLYGVGEVHWLETAYIAERVLTIEELQRFIDARVPAQPLPRASAPAASQHFSASAHLAARLRGLLARRLVRAGRHAEALPYFHEPGSAGFADPDARDHAGEHADALRAAQKAWTRIGRAQSLFRAAMLARTSGMDIMGYELAPDEYYTGGMLALDFSAGQKDQGFVDAAELQRRAASQDPSHKRYHYRYLAAEQAERAADALPPRSQAYAAVLCHAASWMISSHEDDRARAIYQRYVKTGAMVPFGKHFGRRCPEPQFAAARALPVLTAWRGVQRVMRRHPFMVAATGLGGLALIAAGAWHWRRRRTAG